MNRARLAAFTAAFTLLLSMAPLFSQNAADRQYSGPVIQLALPAGWNVVAKGTDATAIVAGSTPPRASADGLILSDDSSASVSGPSAKTFDFGSFQEKHDWIYVAALEIPVKPGMVDQIKKSIRSSVERSKGMPELVRDRFHSTALDGTYLSFTLQGHRVYEAFGYAVDGSTGTLKLLQVHGSMKKGADPHAVRKFTQMIRSISYR